MLKIAALQIIGGLKDAKFLILASLILVVFVLNGAVYSERYRQDYSDFREHEARTTRSLAEAASNLQQLARTEQRLMRPPSPLTFVADGGSQLLPNVVVLNAFERFETASELRQNEETPAPLPLDWVFIIGTLMTLLCVVISYDAVCGEKSDGTLRLLLSNPVSKLQLFLGKFLGLFLIVALALALGVLADIVAIALLNGPPLSAEIMVEAASAVAMALLCLSAFLFLGLAISALTSRPAVALVVLLVIWTLSVVVVPGIARLTAEQMQPVPSRVLLERQTEEMEREVRGRYPQIAGMWRGRPQDEHVPMRAEMFKTILAERRRIWDTAVRAKIDQASLIHLVAAVCPPGLLSNSLGVLCGTGVQGFELLVENSERYRGQFHDFVVQRDLLDPDSPHLVYVTGRERYDRGVFSKKEAPASAIPRWVSLWTAGGLSVERPWPAYHVLLLIGYNLLAGLAALVALLRYDPR